MAETLKRKVLNIDRDIIWHISSFIYWDSLCISCISIFGYWIKRLVWDRQDTEHQLVTCLLDLLVVVAVERLIACSQNTRVKHGMFSHGNQTRIQPKETCKDTFKCSVIPVFLLHIYIFFFQNIDALHMLIDKLTWQSQGRNKKSIRVINITVGKLAIHVNSCILKTSQSQKFRKASPALSIRNVQKPWAPHEFLAYAGTTTSPFRWGLNWTPKKSSRTC